MSRQTVSLADVKRREMKRFRFAYFRASLLISITAFAGNLAAQDNFAPTMDMHMRGMENSAGILASGTAIEPSNTSEFSNMMQGSLRKWTVMFHADSKVTEIQQRGPRGGDKFFSTNWV